MNTIAVRVAIALIAVAAVSAQKISSNQKGPATQKPVGQKTSTESPAISQSVDRGAKWLVSVQGADGGWGQDGDGTSRLVNDQRLESNGNDVANTAVAALALLRAGKQYQPNVDRALTFILQRIETSPTEGLSVTKVQGTQIQRKLGPYIDTFLASMLLAQVDGTLAKAADNTRVRQALQKCVAKIEKNQKGDGSWNLAGGWAPVLGTSLASRSLYDAKAKGLAVDGNVLDKAESYTVNAMKAPAAGAGAGSAGGIGAGRGAAFGTVSESVAVSADSAGVPLYQSAQALEQLSRTDADRRKNAKAISSIGASLTNERFVDGFGSIGGEEFFSYLNISDGLKRTGGQAWTDWHTKITHKIVKLQNNDGTWAGHHCITGRVAVTAAAMLNLTVDRAN